MDALLQILSDYKEVISTLVQGILVILFFFINRNIRKVEVATNSMKDALIAGALKAGITEGRQQVQSEQALASKAEVGIEKALMLACFALASDVWTRAITLGV